MWSYVCVSESSYVCVMITVFYQSRYMCVLGIAVFYNRPGE